MRTRATLFTACLSFLGLLPLPLDCRATLLVYDAFLDGGATPNTGAGEYRTGTAPQADSLNSQAPTIAGFTADGWAQIGAFANTVYYRTESGQLSYSDTSGNSLITASGQLNLFRSASASDTDKDIARPLDIGTSLPNTLYLSLLVQKSGTSSFRLRSGSTDTVGGSTRRFNFGIKRDGVPYVTGTGAGSGEVANTNVVVSSDQPHLLVAKLVNDGFADDQIHLYLDPDLTDEGMNTPVASLIRGNFYVGGNADWSLLDIYLQNRVVNTPSSVIMDELRIGTTWEDVTPHVAIPEPSSLSLLLAGLLLLGRSACRNTRPQK